MPQPPMRELDLIERIRRSARQAERRSPALRLGIGDDCAILAPPAGHEILVTTDFSLEGRHFRRDWHTAESAGHRCLARGLSDLAAMGARPLGAFLSLALPPGYELRWVDRFLTGLLALGAAHKVPLAGGDTAQAPGTQILADIVLIGSAPRGQALRRSGARLGNRIFVTGALGGAAAELQAMSRRGRPGRTRGPQSFPEPRLRVGQALLRRGLASACIDLSDGLATDLRHLCLASGVAAELDSSAIPVHGLAHGRMELALTGGEDYELLFTTPADARVPAKIAGVPVTQIGRIIRGKEPAIQLDGKPFEAAGWEHFGGR